MIVGIDMDGTITKHPELFRILVKGLQAEGNSVHIITCRLEPEAVVESLNALGIGFDEVHTPVPEKDFMTVGEWKAEVCREVGVDIMFEDSPDVLVSLPEGTDGIHIM